MTAQEEYARLVKDFLGPRLRDLGFKGSAGRYSLDSDTTWRLLGLQKSTSNTQDRVRFYINLTKIDRDEWSRLKAARPHFPDVPAPNNSYIRDDTERLTGPGPSWDGWYVLAGTDLAALADAIIAALVATGLPWLTDTEPTTQRSQPAPGPRGLLARWLSRPNTDSR